MHACKSFHYSKLFMCMQFLTLHITLQTFGGCYESYNVNLTYYPNTQQVTHTILQHFYNGYILHRRFIVEVMLVELKLLRFIGQNRIYHLLNATKKQLEYNIVRLHYLVSLCV